MPNPVSLVAFKRTPVAIRGGALHSMPAFELAATAARAILSGTDLADKVGIVYYGSSRLAGQGPNPARRFALASGLPNRIPAVTVSSACSSGVEALLAARAAILSGEAEYVLVGAAESMSRTPRAIFQHWAEGEASEYADLHLTDGLLCPLTGMLMVEQAEILAKTRGITRERCDAFARRSHTLYAENQNLHIADIIPVGGLTSDMNVRPAAKLDRLPKLAPLLGDNGILTAGTVGAVADGGCAMLVAARDFFASVLLNDAVRVAGKPSDTCTMPVPALRALSSHAGQSLTEMGAIEINEGFASQVIACCDELGIGEWTVNRFGGTLAIGHPTGFSGLRVAGLYRRAIEQGLISSAALAIPVSGGQAVALSLGKAT